MEKAEKGDICFSCIWILVGLYVIYASHSLGLGELQTPGAGFTPFVFGLMLTGFSLINLATHFGKKKESRPLVSYSAGAYAYLGVMVGALILYGILVERIGFLIMTSVVLTALFRIAGCNWKISIIWGPVVACGSYFIFTYLGVMLPAGIIKL